LPSIARGGDDVDLGVGQLRVARQAQHLGARAIRARETLLRHDAGARLAMIRDG
jgi:hypothetical protein